MMAPTLNLENHLVIRAMEQQDLDVFSQYRNLPEVAHFQSWSSYTLADAKKLLANTNYQTFGQTGNWYQLAIADANSDSLLGDLAVHFIDEHQAEIGFTLAPQNQGKGYASKAVHALLNYLFTQHDIHRVIAITDTKNTASYKLLEKVGFRREAHFKQNVFFKGAWGDEFLYALLKSEF